MVEFKGVIGQFWPKWQELEEDFNIFPGRFNIFMFRINGIVYQEWSDEFKKSYEQEIIWKKLQKKVDL